MRIAHVRSQVLVIFGITAGGRNITIATSAGLGNLAGPVGIGLTTALLIDFLARLVDAALVLVVAGLALGAGIFRVGGLDLRFGLGEFVLKLDVRLVALVLIVLRRPLAAVVLA